MKSIYSYVAMFGLLASVAKADSVDEHLSRIDSFLTTREMTRLVPDRNALNIYRLAEEEDMELKDDYLISDALLKEVKRGALAESKEFSNLMEAFQQDCDKLNEMPRKEALARWKTLWLQKVSAHLRYLKSLQPIWAVDVNQTLDYDSNVRLRPQDDTVSTFSNKSDVGATHALGLTLRPFINKKKSSDWSYDLRASGLNRTQADIEDVEYNTIGFTNTVGWWNISPKLTAVDVSQGFERSYSDNPSDPRMEFDQHSLGVNATFLPCTKEGGYFKSANWRSGLSYRMKEEFKNDNGVKNQDEDLDSYSIYLSQNFTRSGKNIPLETLSWNVNVEMQDSSPNAYRKYSTAGVGVNYSRSLNDIYKKFPLTWRSALEVRVKDWGDARTAAGFQDPESEGQYSLSTSLRSRWTANFSSKLNLSYMRKDKDVTNAGSETVNQFKVSINNTFLTF